MDHSSDRSTPVTAEHHKFMMAHSDVLAALKQRDYEALRRAIERQRAVIQAHKKRIENLIRSL